MDRLNTIFADLLEAIRHFRASNRQTFNLIVAASGVAPVIAIAFYLLNPGAPIMLATNLSPADRTALALRLRRHQIDFTLGPDSITVPSRSLGEAQRLLEQSPGFPGGDHDFSLFDSPTMGQSDFDEQVKYQRSLQGELERTIMDVRGVESARVMLAMGHPSPFALGTSEAARASVMLTTSAGAIIDATAARAIAHLVASSVRGLTAENVTITGNDGTILFPSPHESELGEAIRMRSEVERGLQDKVSTLLSRIMGENRYAVAVSVDVDTSRVTSKDELYGKGDQTVLSEEHSATPVTAQPGGIPGLTSNLPVASPSAAPTPATAADKSEAGKPPETVAKQESSADISRRDVVNYKPSLRQIETVTAPMRIKRISVAAVLDGTYEGSRFVPVSDARLAAVKNLLAAAIGAEKDRGDSVDVQTAALSQPYVPLVPNSVAQLKVLMSNPLYLYGSAAAGVVLLMCLLWLVKRAFSHRSAARRAAKSATAAAAESAKAEKQQPLEVSPAPLLLEPQPAINQAPSDSFAQIRIRINQEAERDPEAAADLLRRWMKQGNGKAAETHSNGGPAA